MGIVDIEKARKLGWKDSEIDRLLESLAKLEQKHLVHETEIQELKGQIDILNNQLNRQDRVINDQDWVIENLKQQNKGLKAILESYKDAIKRL